MNGERTVVELHQVSVAYTAPNGIRPVLTDFDLTIPEGQWVAIVGENGCGKSTLAKVLAGLCSVSRGTIHVRDEGVIQMVFQNPEAQIVGETVYEDLCFGMENRAVDPAEMSKRVHIALEQVGLTVPLDQPTTQLSGGQKQLLSIAGCLAVQAPVIVFDEATAMLDPLGRERVLNVVQNLHRQGKTIIWITQWMEELAYCERVIALSGSKIVFDGNQRDFFYRTDRNFLASPCEQLGFLPPYAVQVAKCLLQQGFSLSPLPTSPVELSQSVIQLCQ